MSETPRLNLPEIASGQAQKHVTHNDALAILDVLVQVAVETDDQTAPPGSPAEGELHIVAASATGDWTGQDGKLANWRDGSWSFYAAKPGCLAWVVADDAAVLFDGTDWIALAEAVPLQELESLGINTTADSTNRLSVRGPAALFSGIEAASGGDGDMRVIVNKETAGDSASHLFQSGFSGRAEFGLTGDDDFHLKVSTDGSAWTEAIVVDAATGYVGLGTSTPTCPLEVSGDAYVSGYLGVGAAPGIWRANFNTGGGLGVLFQGGAGQDAMIRISGGSFFDIEPEVGRLVFEANGSVDMVHFETDGRVYLPSGKLDANADTMRLRQSKTPASAADTGNQGDIAWDSGFIYVCTATNTWKRPALASW